MNFITFIVVQRSSQETCTFKETHVVQGAESLFPGSFKVATEEAKVGGRGQVSEEKLPFHPGNSLARVKGFQRRETETDLNKSL